MPAADPRLPSGRPACGRQAPGAEEKPNDESIVLAFVLFLRALGRKVATTQRRG